MTLSGYQGAAARRGSLRDAASLGCYMLPGGVKDPTPAIERARRAEALGLGTAWLSERFDTKDLPSIAGAITQVTSRVQISTGVTPFGVRHPMVLASMGQTLQALSKERYWMGFGRSASWRWRMYGYPAPTLQSMADTVDILRRLWAGETVTYDGPAGKFPELRLVDRASTKPPPILLAAIGPKSLALAGEHFDGAILHPFLSPEAVRRSFDIVRGAAAKAGRDPQALRCVASVVVAPDMTPEQTAHAIRARGAGYFQVSGLGDMLVAANAWDTEDLVKYRNHPILAELAGRPADKILPRQTLIDISYALPEHWIPSTSAAGSSLEVARRLHDYLDAGADDLLLHGATPEFMSPMVEAFVAERRVW